MATTTPKYDDVGKGLPLVLIHGFPHDRRLWRPQLEGLKHIARVIAPDLPGFGERGAWPGQATMENYAADVKALLDSLGIERAVIGGLSMGGYVALAFWASFPHMVQALVLCNTRAGADNDEARTGRLAMIKKVTEEGVSSAVGGMIQKMLAPATRIKDPVSEAFVGTMMGEQSAEGVIDALNALASRPDRTTLLHTINVPTLIITGSADTLISPSESEAMAHAISNSELVVIPDVAHLSNREAPHLFNRALSDFLSTLG